MAYIKADDKQEQEYFDFLEDLRQSGETNMFGASPYLVATFALSKQQAIKVLSKWMKLHDDPKRFLEKPLSKEKITTSFVTTAEMKREERS